MPVSGADVLRELQSALEAVRERTSAVQTQWQKLDGRMNDLLTRDAVAFAERVGGTLPTGIQESMPRAFAEIQREFRESLERKDERVDELADLLEQIEADTTTTVHDLDVVTGRLNEKARRRDEMQDSVATDLSNNAEFRSLSAQAIACEQQIQDAEKRFDEPGLDDAEKQPAREDSWLSRYLDKRGFGTETYQSQGLPRLVDRCLSRLIDFDPARQSDGSFRTPEQMQAFQTQMQQIEELSESTAEEAGLVQVLSDVDLLGLSRDTLVARVDQQNGRHRQIETELLSLQMSQGEYYERALRDLGKTLTSLANSRPEHHAEGIDNRDTDRTAARLDSLTEKIDDLQRSVGRLADDTLRLDDQCTGLDAVIRTFRKANWDSQLSFFEEDPLPRHRIDQFLDCRISRSELWETLCQWQQFEPTWSERLSRAQEVVPGPPLADTWKSAMFEACGPASSTTVRGAIQRYSARCRADQASAEEEVDRTDAPHAVPDPRGVRNTRSSSRAGF